MTEWDKDGESIYGVGEHWGGEHSEVGTRLGKGANSLWEMLCLWERQPKELRRWGLEGSGMEMPVTPGTETVAAQESLERKAGVKREPVCPCSS